MKLKIGILLVHSNVYPTIGRDFVDGLELALDNAPYEIIVEGIGLGADMDQITASVQKLVNQHRVHVLTGLLGHHLIENLVALVDNLGVPMVYSDLGAKLPIGAKPKPHIFCNSFNMCHSSFLAGKYLAEQGLRKVAYSSCFYEVGYGFTQAFEQGLYGAGGEFTGHFITPHTPRENEADMMEQFMGDAKPDAIYAQYSGIFAQEHATFITQNKVALQYPMFASHFAVEDKVLAQFPGIFDQTCFVTSWQPEDENPANQQFIEAYNEQYDRVPTAFSLLGFENGKALALVIGSVQKQTASELRRAFETVRFESPRGEFNFHPDTHRTSMNQALWRIEATKEAYTKQRMAQFDNQHGLTLEWINKDGALPGGWYNAYLCQ